MKKKLALLAAPIVFLSTSAAMAEHPFGITPYVGFDAELRHMDFQKGFGDNVIQHNYPQGNIYVGARINEYVAVEAGYEATERKTRTSTVRERETLLGFTLGAIDPITLNATSQVKGLHANLLGFLPICDAYRLQLIGLVGFARLKAKVTTNLLVSGTTALDQDATTINNFRTKKSVLRLGAGLQHMINCNWGVRGMLKWEASKKLKMSASNIALATTFSIRPKNSVIYSIGAFYMF